MEQHQKRFFGPHRYEAGTLKEKDRFFYQVDSDIYVLEFSGWVNGDGEWRIVGRMDAWMNPVRLSSAEKGAFMYMDSEKMCQRLFVRRFALTEVIMEKEEIPPCRP